MELKGFFGDVTGFCFWSLWGERRKGSLELQAPGQTCGQLRWVSRWTSGKSLLEWLSPGAGPALRAPGDVSLAPGPGLMDKLLFQNRAGGLQQRAGEIKVKENHKPFWSGGKIPLCGIRKERN